MLESEKEVMSKAFNISDFNISVSWELKMCELKPSLPHLHGMKHFKTLMSMSSIPYIGYIETCRLLHVCSSLSEIAIMLLNCSHHSLSGNMHNAIGNIDKT